LTAFEGQTFDPCLEGACRIYPHHFDSGGLFLARLRRLGGGERGDAAVEARGEAAFGARGEAALPGWSAVPEAFPDGRTDPGVASETIEMGLDRLGSLFGVGADVLGDFGWIVRGEDLWVHRCESWPLESWGESDRWRVVSVGLRAMVPDYRNRPRPTNDLFRLLETSIMPNMVPLSEDQWSKLLEGEEIAVPGVESGFVPLGLREHVAGRGLVRGEKVRHEIPKVQARWLARVLDLASNRPVSGEGRQPVVRHR
jgi:hypothetical protein